MKLGLYTTAAELQQTRKWVYTPPGYQYEEGEEQVVLHLRPWTRTTQAIVDKRAKAKNIAIMDAEAALKGLGSGDKRGEAYVRELADFLIADWDGIVAASNVFAEGANPPKDRDEAEEFARQHPDLVEIKKGDPVPCTHKFKVFLFEDINVAVQIVEAAKGFATEQIGEEVKNLERSSGGMHSGGISPVPASE